jgi:(S)-ureidoglycine aminohydrolase
MKKLLVILFVIPLIASAQKDTVASGPYDWQQPAAKKNKIASVVLLEGKAHDFEWMQLSANTITGTKAIQQTMPANQEQLIIVKSGTINIRFGDSSFTLTPNSVAVLIPGEKYSLSNLGDASADFYSMKYRKANAGLKGINAGRSFIKLWGNLPFKPNSIGGGRRDFFEQGTVIQKRFEIHVSTLKEGIKSHEPHTHRAEEIVLMIEGDTEMQIGAQFKKVDAGGFYYLGSNVQHAIKNTGTQPCIYFAIQFE